MADAVAEAHEAHAAARCDLEGSARAFLNETALPAAAPGNAPDRERRPAGAHQPGGGPLRALVGVARVQSVGPAPVHGGHPAADGSRVCHVPPQ